MLLLFACALPAGGMAPAPPASGQTAMALAVERVDGVDGAKVYQIASSGTVVAAPAVVWRILTDYNRMAEFVPDLASARVVSRNGDKVVIEQVGAVHMLFVSHPIRLLVQAHEQAPDKIDVRLLEGDMRVYRCSWELVPAPAGGTTVNYTATIAPKFYVPGFIGASIVRKDIGAMMAAVLARLDRPD